VFAIQKIILPLSIIFKLELNKKEIFALFKIKLYEIQFTIIVCFAPYGKLHS